MRIWDPGWKKLGSGMEKKSDAGSVKNNPDPQHCCEDTMQYSRSTSTVLVWYLIHVFVPVFVMECGGRDSRQLGEEGRVRQVEPGNKII